MYYSVPGNAHGLALPLFLHTCVLYLSIVDIPNRNGLRGRRGHNTVNAMNNWSEERLLSTSIQQLQRAQTFHFGYTHFDELRTETPMGGSPVNTLIVMFKITTL